MSALCPMTHREDRQARVVAPLTVCVWHRDRAERAVAELPGLYEFLASRLTGSGTSAPSGMPAAVSKDPGLSLDHRVAQCRTDIRNNLTTWARVAVEERRMTPPADTIPAVAAFIVAQIEWFTSQEFARNFVSDVVDDWGTARALADPNAVRRFEVGPCPEDGCDGTLIARIRPKDSLLPHDVVCDASPEDEETGELTHRWPADRWMTLGRKALRA